MEDADKLKASIGKRMAVLRTARGLTQGDVAERIGTTVPNYQRIEYGLQNVTVETMTRIANAIGVAVADFFGARGDRSRGRSRRTR